jgi:oligopeptide transport system substrate-binding protein
MRKKIIKAVALCAVFSLAVVGLTGCSKKEAASDTISIRGCEPQNPLVPGNTNETCGGNVEAAAFSQLVYFDINDNNKPVMEDAESITPNSDNTEYTVKLKSGLKFSDGSDLTAKNYVDTWNYNALATNAQLNSSFFEDIKGYDAVSSEKPTAKTMEGLKLVDDTTFTITLDSPNSSYIYKIGATAFSPVPESALASKDALDAYGQKPVSNGPYKVDSWDHEKDIVLTPNEYYKGNNPAKNKGITFKIYQENDAAYADLQAGNLDFLDDVPASALGTFMSEPSIQGFEDPSSTFQSFTIPDTLPHFGKNEEGNLRRQAISMAINRQEIVDSSVFHGTRTPAKDFSSPVIAGYSDSLKGNEVLSYNPTKAKELWAEANKISNWGDTKFQISYNGDSSHKDWVDAVCNSIKNVLGIDASGNGIATFAQFRSEITNRQINTAFRTGWQADYPSIENYLVPIYSSAAADGKGSNDGDYKNPEFDKLLSDAAAETDQNKALELYQRAEELLLEDLPAIPLWNGQVDSAVSSKMDKESVKFTYNGTPNYSLLAHKA